MASNPETVAVLAGNFEQFREFEFNNKREGIRYIFAREPLVGYRFSRYEVVGTFWERVDAGRLFDAVKYRMNFERP